MKLLMDGGGYSTRQLGKLAGVSHGTISNWINGTERASLDKVARLAAVFDWTLDELYHGKGDANTLRRLAELEAFRHRAERLARDLLGIAPTEDAGSPAIAEASALTPRSSAPPSVQPDAPTRDRRDRAANE